MDIKIVQMDKKFVKMWQKINLNYFNCHEFYNFMGIIQKKIYNWIGVEK